MKASNLIKVLTSIVMLFELSSVWASGIHDYPRYQPRIIALPKNADYLTSDGAVRVVGYNDMRDMFEAMAPIFAKAQPGVRIEWDLRGTRFAPAALASGASAFAPWVQSSRLPRWRNFATRPGRNRWPYA